jgi:hypothetical protein
MNKISTALFWCLYITAAFVTTLFWALCLQTIWARFIVPCFGTAPLTIAGAVGAGLVYDYMAFTIRWKLQAERKSSLAGAAWDLFASNILMPLLTVGMALVYKIMLGL